MLARGFDRGRRALQLVELRAKLVCAVDVGEGQGVDDFAHYVHGVLSVRVGLLSDTHNACHLFNAMIIKEKVKYSWTTCS